MYEDIKYEDLRKLPDDQKKIALEELMDKFKSNKAIGEAVGAAPIAISNMYKSSVLGEHVGRTKKEKTEEPKQELAPETINPTSEVNHPEEVKPKRSRKSKVEKPEQSLDSSANEAKELVEYKENVLDKKNEVKYEIPEEKIIYKSNENTQSIKYTSNLSGTIAGDETKERIIGIAHSILNSKRYKVSIVIEEI